MRFDLHPWHETLRPCNRHWCFRPCWTMMLQMHVLVLVAKLQGRVGQYDHRNFVMYIFFVYITCTVCSISERLHCENSQSMSNALGQNMSNKTNFLTPCWRPKWQCSSAGFIRPSLKLQDLDLQTLKDKAKIKVQGGLLEVGTALHIVRWLIATVVRGILRLFEYYICLFQALPTIIHMTIIFPSFGYPGTCMVYMCIFQVGLQVSSSKPGWLQRRPTRPTNCWCGCAWNEPMAGCW